MSGDAARLRDNLQDVRERIAQAAQRAGRSASDVTLIAVTKYVGVDAVAGLVEQGCFDLGESRPQELWRKAELLPDPRIRWHLIGHLQRNKVARSLPLVHQIHSVDSERLMRTIDEAAATLPRPVSIFCEVNVAREPNKHGFSVEELAEVVPRLASYRHLQIVGLMAMARQTEDPEVARQDFRALKHLQQDLQARFPQGPRFEQLSMGMSGDFEVAIEEGAHLVRVGSALFEGTGYAR